MSDDKVVSVFGGPTGEPAPNEILIATLERALEAAKAGEIVGGAIAYLHSDGHGSFNVAGQIGGYSMLGAVEMAKSYIVEINKE